jgi:hypothetical protein
VRNIIGRRLGTFGIAGVFALLLPAPSRVGAQVARLEPGPRPTVADAAPDFELETVDGLPFRLFEAAAGRPVVLQFAGCT